LTLATGRGGKPRDVLDDMGNPEEALVELKKGLDVLVSVYGHEHRTWRTRI